MRANMLYAKRCNTTNYCINLLGVEFLEWSVHAHRSKTMHYNADLVFKLVYIRFLHFFRSFVLQLLLTAVVSLAASIVLTSFLSQRSCRYSCILTSHCVAMWSVVITYSEYSSCDLCYTSTVILQRFHQKKISRQVITCILRIFFLSTIVTLNVRNNLTL